MTTANVAQTRSGAKTQTELPLYGARALEGAASATSRPTGPATSATEAAARQQPGPRLEAPFTASPVSAALAAHGEEGRSVYAAAVAVPRPVLRLPAPLLSVGRGR